MWTRLAADLEDVAKPLAGDHPAWRALALENQVRRDRGAVPDVSDFRGVGTAFAEKRRHAVADRLRWIVRSGRHLVEGDRTVRLAHQGEVREGAADIDADPVHVGSVALFDLDVRVLDDLAP